MTEAAAPIAAGERILTLDVVRGVALLGIFIMNMPYFGMSFFSGVDGLQEWPEWWNRTATVLRDVLMSGKFNSMFSLLFAVGFTIQLERLLRNSGPVGMRVYVRRIFWLLMFGVVHACVFWTGDVLHMYALFGFALLAVRLLSDRVIIAMLIACLLYTPIAGVIELLITTPEDLERTMELAGEWKASNDIAYGSGSFFDAAREHTREMVFAYTNSDMLLAYLSFYVQLFTTVLIGLLLGRHAFFQRAAEQLSVVRRVQWWALGVGAVTGLVFGVREVMVEDSMMPTVWGIVASVSYTLCRVSTMAFYVCLIVRGVHHPRWRERLVPLSLAGRMPLSNYLLQTLAGTLLFYGWGLGRWETIGPALSVLIAVVFFFAVQLPLSAWWLMRFEIGPMEYVWRRLSYGRLPARAPSADG